MREQVLNASAKVVDVKGDAILVRPGNAAVLITPDMQLQGDDIVFSSRDGEIVIDVQGQSFLVERNCVACLNPYEYGNVELTVAPVNTDIVVDQNPASPSEDTLDLDAIQAAILAGEDPTEILEAPAAGPAAGAGGAGSSNNGLVTITATRAENLASTQFDTIGLQRASEDDDLDDNNILFPAEGGLSITTSVSEGSLSDDSYTQTTVTEATIVAGSVALDPTTFAPTDASLTALLAELNAEITSSGSPVSFVYDAASNSIVGTQDGETVLTIDIDTVSAGANVTLSLTTTIERAIDHNVSAGSTGLVRFTDNNLEIDISIQGEDVGGNTLLDPLELTITIVDGANQSATPVNIDYTEATDLSTSTPFATSGQVFEIGSDALQDIRFDESVLTQFDSLLSNNSSLVASLSDDGRTLTVVLADDPTISVLQATVSLDGNYTLTLSQPLEESNTSLDITNISLPVTSTDYDGDIVTNSIDFNVTDGADISVGNSSSSVTLTETTTLDGTDGHALTATESVAFSKGSDAIEDVEWVIPTATQTILNNITSNDRETNYELSSDGKTITVKVDGSNETVMTLTLNSNLSGEYTVMQYLPIDQDNATDGDSLGVSASDFDLQIKATDTDGDETTASVAIEIVDGANATVGNTNSSVTLTETKTLDGTDGHALTATESVAFSKGSDAIEDVEWVIPTATQTILNNITSNDRETNYELSSDGKTITVKVDGSNETVMTLTLNSNLSGEYTLTQYLPIDQDNATDGDSLGVSASDFDLQIKATDTDGDETTATISIEIVDGPDATVGEPNSSVTLTETKTLDGTDGQALTAIESVTFSKGSDAIEDVEWVIPTATQTILNNITSNDRETSYELSSDGKTITVKVDGSNETVMTLTLNSDLSGEYTVKQYLPIDQDNATDGDSLGVSASDFDLQIKATDTDGDETTATISIEIVDGPDATVGEPNSSVTLTETKTLDGTDGQALTAIESVTFSKGSDAIEDVEWVIPTATQTILNNITSNDRETSYELSSDGKTITVKVDGSNETVMTLTLNSDLSGEYTVKQYLPIDQDNATDGDSLGVSASDFDLQIKATDTDGDETRATISIEIVDGPDATVGDPTSSVTLIETKTLDGTDGHALTATESVAFSKGSDAIEDVEWVIPTATQTILNNITSNDRETSYELSSDGKTITVKVDGSNETVMTLTLNSNLSGEYTVKQYLPIDQDNATDGDSLGVSASDFDLQIKATDTDGDETTASVAIEIVDGANATVGNTNSSVTLIETKTLDGTDGHALTATESVALSKGSDAIEDVEWVIPAATQTILNNLTSNDRETSYELSSDGKTITVKVDGSNETVMTLTLNSNLSGEYTVKQYLPIDQDNATDGDSLGVSASDFDLEIKATDTDGDTTSAEINVKIDDGTDPVITGNTPLSLNESNLSDGSQPDSVATTKQGSISVDAGSDAIDHYEINVTNFNTQNSLSTDGKPITLVETTSPGGSPDKQYTGRFDSNGDGTLDSDAFVVEVSQNGNYSFELLETLDHDKTNSDTELLIDIPVIAVDTDGDKSSDFSLDVTVTDDTPELRENLYIKRDENQTKSKTIDVFSDNNNKTEDGHAGSDSIQNIEIVLPESDADIAANFPGAYDLDLANIILEQSTTDTTVYTLKYNFNSVVYEIGTLDVNNSFNGKVTFTGSGDDLPFGANGIHIPLYVKATDGDNDIVTEPLKIYIDDRNSSITKQKVTVVEDQGSQDAHDNSDSNVLTPKQLSFTVNVGDVDSNETVSAFYIKELDTKGDQAGKFYTLSGGSYVLLDNTTKPGWYTVTDSSLISAPDSDGNVTISGIYFIPEEDFSTTDNKYDTFVLDARVSRDDAKDENVSNSNIKIKVEAIADNPVWDKSDSDTHKEHETISEGETVVVKLNAQPSDPTDEEIIEYRLEIPAGEIDAATDSPKNYQLIVDGQVVTPKEDNGVYYYILDADDIEQGKVVVEPLTQFSGQISFKASAISEEQGKLINTEKAETLDVDKVDLVYDVEPVADVDSALLTVSRVSIEEDSSFDLNDHITVNRGDDSSDGSESVLVSITGLPEGASISAPGHTYTRSDEPIELDYTDISNGLVTFKLPAESNIDFNINVTASIKDTAQLSTGEGTDTQVIGSSSIYVDIKGIADQGVISTTGTTNTWIESADGIETTISENGEATLDFKLFSGEGGADENVSEDSSEKITLVIRNNGSTGEYKIVDADTGNGIDTTYVGTTADGYPKYELQTGSDIKVIPTNNTTDDIHLFADIIVTENDGNVSTTTKRIDIKVTPEITGFENSVYSNSVSGQEDSTNGVDIDWYPQGQQLNDSESGDKEFVSKVVVGGGSNLDGITLTIETSSSYKLYASNGDLITPAGASYTFNATEQVTIVANDGAELTKGNLKITSTTPKDSSEDFSINTSVTVKEIDTDTSDVSTNSNLVEVEAVYTGSVNVNLRATLEHSDLDVTQSGADVSGVQSISGGKAEFTVNDPSSSDYSINFADLDTGISGSYDSVEKVDQVIVDFGFGSGGVLSANEEHLLDQLFVSGAVNIGGGQWIVTSESDFAINAPNGLYNLDDSLATLNVKIHATATDMGDESDPVSSKVTSKTVSFIFEDPDTNNSVDTIAATPITDDVVVQGLEDQIPSVDLDGLMESAIKIDPSTMSDLSQDQITLVFDFTNAPKGTSVTSNNGEDNFVDGKKFPVTISSTNINADGTLNSDALGELSLTLPADYAGQLSVPYTVIVTDITSGDENEQSGNITVEVTPVIDGVKDTSLVDGEYDIVQGIVTDGVNGEAQHGEPGVESPEAGKAYEDSQIKLNLNHFEWKDSSTNLSEGLESFSTLTITPDTNVGGVITTNITTGVTQGADGSITIDASVADMETVLSGIKYTPPKDYSGDDVTLSLSGTIIDKTSGLGAGVTVTDTNFNATVSFDIQSVVDGVTTASLGDKNISGDEDTSISLTGLNFTLDDTDGSEEFVSFKLTSVPDDFLVQASNSSQFTVSNNGNGEWSIRILDMSVVNNGTVDLSGIQIIPAEDFSGDVTLGYVVYTQEKDDKEPKEQTGDINLTVNPVADTIDTRIDSSVSLDEGEKVTIAINAKVIDGELSTSLSGENPAETVYLRIENVPEGALIGIPSKTAFDPTNPAASYEYKAQPEMVNGTYTGAWIVETNLQQVSSVELDMNGLDLNNNSSGTWNPEVTIKAYSDDNGQRDSATTEASDTDVDAFDMQVVTIDITPKDDAPVVDTPLTTSVNEDSTTPLNLLTGISDADIATDGDSLSVVSVSGNQGGVFTDKGNGIFDYKPAENFNGVEIITYVVEDSTGNQITTTATVTVNPISDIPLLSTERDRYVAAINSSTAASIMIASIVGSMQEASATEIVSLQVTDVPSGASIWVDGSEVLSSNGTYTIASASANIEVRVDGVTETSDIKITAVAKDGDASPQTSDTSLIVTLDVGNSIDGTTGEDHLVNTTNQSVTISGGDGNDILIGGEGDDILLGGEGNDVLIGGLGSDQMTGGIGADTFAWSDASIDNGATDTITDFNLGEDKLHFGDLLQDHSSADEMNTLLSNIQTDVTDATNKSVTMDITVGSGADARTQTIKLEHLSDEDITSFENGISGGTGISDDLFSILVSNMNLD
ncbi:retention module-containing protein [Vibrio sp. HN007]|uniref:retention module-containing protein n=1 Tax=Vibrio iocasae TaxID=3098914 RepID=UPI0035D44002